MEWILEFVAPIIVLVIGALLSRRDADQQRQIDSNKSEVQRQISELKAQSDKDFADLQKHRDNHYRQHDEDSKALQSLREQIAREHYQKHELDQKFDKLETTTRDGLASVVSEIRQLSNAMLQHLAEERKEK